MLGAISTPPTVRLFADAVRGVRGERHQHYKGGDVALRTRSRDRLPCLEKSLRECKQRSADAAIGNEAIRAWCSRLGPFRADIWLPPM